MKDILYRSTKLLFVIFWLFLSGCATVSGLTGKQMIEKDLNKQEQKGALVVCVKANALLYGTGKIVYARAAEDFKGTITIKDCGVNINNDDDEDEE